MAFHGNNLSKSLSISNIAGYAEDRLRFREELLFVISSDSSCSLFRPMFDEMPMKGFRYLSQSTDSLNRTNQVTESMESLTDEGPPVTPC